MQLLHPNLLPSLNANDIIMKREIKINVFATMAHAFWELARLSLASRFPSHSAQWRC
jgi:hypothetical protein